MLSCISINAIGGWATTRGARGLRFRLAVLATITCIISTSSRAQAAPAYPRDRAHVREREDPSGHRQSHQAHTSDRVLVRFQPHVAERARQAIRAAAGVARVRHRFRAIKGLELLEVPAGRVGSAVAALRRQGAVRYAEPDYQVHAVGLPDDPDFAQLWGLQNTGQSVNGMVGTPGADINVVPAWEAWTGDADFRIAVIDTGIQWDHPDLQANVWTNPGEVPGNGIDDDGNGWVDDVHGYDFSNDDGDPYDDQGHGTHVSGTIAAVGNNAMGIAGVNWRCSIVGLKFLDSTGFGFTSDAIEALDYATASGIQISNNSWGGSSPSQALRDAIEASQNVGHLFVAAAGNLAQNTDTFPFYPASFTLPNVISVAAIDNSDHLAYFSNYGLASVDIAAPGVAIYSTIPVGTYGYKNGTSMASPHVAGVAALIRSRFPSLTWQQTKDRILASVRPVPELDGLIATGGVVDASAALSDCNGNGVPDDQDIANGTSQDCTANGIPDECESDCNANGESDTCDTLNGTSADCNANEVPDECESDCNQSGIPDDCDVANGTSADCNANEIPDECEADCNQNGAPDLCDIADGTSADCDGNALPDECDVVNPANDCNGNAIPDVCDLANGVSQDCNQNGIPDECLTRELDCNGNGSPDECDVAGPFSDDCDGDLIPDECETSPDCNGNGVADEIDICHTVSTDCNFNAVPDECDIDAGTANDCNTNGTPDACESNHVAFFLARQLEDPSPRFVTAMQNAGYRVFLHGVIPDYQILVSGNGRVLFPADRTRLFSGEIGLIYLDETNGNDVIEDAYPFAADQRWQLRRGARVVDAASPLAEGLPSTTSLHGLAMAPTLRPGANTVIAWDDGTPMVVTYRFGAGRVVYINNAGGWLGSSFWDGDPNFGERLFQNALAWVTPDDRDCNRNGQLDSCEIAGGFATDILPAGGDGIPDGCQRDCNANGRPDDEDVLTGSSTDCDNNGIPDECASSGVDCDENGFLDICELQSTGGLDCNANGLLDICEPDCDQNGQADVCDVAGGLTEDCNHNNVPDECEPFPGCAGGPRAGFFGPMPYTYLHLRTMEQQGINVQTVNRLLTPSDPSQFELLVFGAGVYRDSPELSAAMDAFIHAGGGLVYFVEDGRIAPPYLGLGSPLDDLSIPFLLGRSNVDIVDASSPLSAGLDRIGTFYGVVGIPILKDSARVAMRWREGSIPYAITYEYGAGRVVWINQLESQSEPPWTSDPNFGAQLFRNALNWVLGVGDCNGNGIPDDQDIVNGLSLDVFPTGGDGIPDECQADCNGNGIPDDLDIVNGLSLDVLPTGGDGVPDECQSDCNVNGVPDDLDIADGTSPDLNGNGTPDECENVIPAISSWGVAWMTISLLIVATLVLRRSSSELPASRDCRHREARGREDPQRGRTGAAQHPRRVCGPPRPCRQ